MKVFGVLITMKVLILIGNLIAGGIERQGIHDANALSEAGFNIYLGFLKDGRYRSLLAPSVHLIDFSGATYISSMYRIFHFCRKEHIEIICSHHVVLNLISAITAKLIRCKCIVNEHGLSLNSKLRHVQMRRLTYLFANEIIAACKATLEVRHNREGLSSNRGVVVYNCFRNVTNDDLGNNATFLREELNLPENSIIIGTVTRMHPAKCVDLFVDMAEVIRRKHRNVYFVILGDGQLYKNIEQKILDLKMSNYIFPLGFKKNVTSYLKQFDLFALTSKIEANSLALLEALSMRIPCLAFNVGGNSEIIQNGYNGYLAEFPNVSGLAEYASLLIEQDEMRCEMGGNAAEDVFTRFSPEVRLSRLKNIFLNVLQNG